MFFSRAVVDLRQAHRVGLSVAGDSDYQGHQLVWSLFRDHAERERDFVYRWDTASQAPVIYVVSEREPQDREGVFELLTKDFRPSLEKGQRLAFSVRINPVVKRRDENNKRVVHDVVMNAKKAIKDAGEWSSREFTLLDLARDEGIKWLTSTSETDGKTLKSRAEKGGFEVKASSVGAENYVRRTFKKPRNGRGVTFATLDLHGELVVNDPEAFKHVLFEGIGPTKAYGCGLMMVRPVI
ncbi:type I-E CRISPR-associated protein Cas6/Cse3/CasE [Lujinxingia sediminis]|uniref:Type I-E CRISPR-associated protein Cas6/Cse3/CasE n=1 Tax=Lujinxingia sediminis TaxID=2480984 RepID=A0ABY0CTX3_9DELT|nr:type I-E CRISPR-associated protein Cas6/Cse3/CasE [Lujinxingia sediminis]RVU45717.1 type I-E CRISPR-associated protein Cas6/Cse3/CasE [Lujinxingia sediminis]